MADIILHRRSFTTGSVPTTESLGVAQFAINVPDGKVFIHKSSSESQSIVSVLTTDSITTGSITLTGTASAGIFIGFFSGSFSGSIKDADSASFLKAEQPFIDFSTGSAISTWKSGRLFWDTGSDTLALYSSASDVMLNIGQETWTRVYNASGTAITNGTVVKLVGTHGDVPQVELAAAIQVSGSMTFESQVLGVATHDIGVGAFGMVTTQGLLRGLNTNAFSDGDTLYVSSSAGLFTNIAPLAPWEIIPVGQVVKAGPGSSGIIYVSVEQPMDFSDLSSVKVEGSYTLGDLFSYQRSGSVNVWRHTNNLSGSYNISGTLNLSGSQSISGSLTVSNSVNILGDQIITGSLIVSNSVTTIGTHTLTGSFNLTGSLVASSSTIHMYQSTSVSGTNIFGTASWSNNTLTASYIRSDYEREIHVSRNIGSDTTGDGSFLFPFRTIGKALHSASSGIQIVVHPGTYEENPTVSGSASNITITATNNEIGGIVQISGSLTVNQTISSTRISGLTISDLVHTGSQNLYLQNSRVISTVTKNSSGYLEFDKVGLDFPAAVNITGPGSVVITNSIIGVVTVNNAAAVVNLSNNISMISPTCTLGTLLIDGGVIYSQHINSGSVLSGVGAIVSVANALCLTPSSTSASIKLNAASGYSIQNVSYDRANSTLGVSLGNRSQFQQIQADGITGSFTGSFAGTVTSAETASFANSGFTINSSSLYSFGRTSSFLGINSFSVPTGSSRGSILNYTVASASNARAGQVMSIWSGTTASYSETQTTDIGNTSGVSLTSSISGVNSLYTFGTSTAGWNIKFTVTQI